LRLGKSVRRFVDAELVVNGLADKRLGEYGAVKMTMKLATLRHALEEIVQSKRIAANGIERLGGAQLGLAGFTLGGRQRWYGDERGNDGYGSRNPHGGYT
jgi:hypothetical protein